MRISALLNLATIFLLFLCALLLTAMLWPLPEQKTESIEAARAATIPAASQAETRENCPSERSEESVPPSQPAANPAPSQAETQNECPSERSEEFTSTDPSASPSLPQALFSALSAENLSPEDLTCTQLVLILALPGEERETLTTCYELRNGTWSHVESLTGITGHVGRNGLAHDRRRNTETTPAGLWPLGCAFGNSPQPAGMSWPWRDVSPNSEWVCDENSPYFNTWQERGDPSLEPWSEDVEHLADYPGPYAYACVIEYNTPPGEVIPDRGCAIFLHCSKGPTGGCVGLPESSMIRLLQWLDPSARPQILITETS